MENTDTSLKMSIVVSPEKANFRGVMHGGDLLKSLDHVAYACATRYSGAGVVTFAIDEVRFRRPIPIGSILHFYASINYVGKTSCEVGIRTECENPKTREIFHCNSAYFTMVALDEKGEKVAFPPYQPSTEDQKRRYERALQRIQKRFS